MKNNMKTSEEKEGLDGLKSKTGKSSKHHEHMGLYGVIIMFIYVVNIKYQGKHYQWNKPEEENEKFNNFVWNGRKYLSRPYEVIV